MTATKPSSYCPNFSSYKEGCRCDACREYHAWVQRNYRRRLAERKWGVDHNNYVSSEASYKAVWSAHHDLGIPLNEIARVSGVTKHSIFRIYHQKNRTVEASTEERILTAYGPGAKITRSLSYTHPVPWEPHAWKVYALLAQGWTLNHLKAILKAAGRPHGFLNNVNDPHRPNTSVQSIEQVDWLVEKIGDRHGPSNINRTYFQGRGMFPLIHYTEDGKLIRASLTSEQRARVRSVHDKSSGSGHGPGSHPGRG